MGFGSRLLWGSVGWVLGGPIGAIIGYSLASMSETRQSGAEYSSYYGIGGRGAEYPKTKSGDFAISLLVLFAYIMKADKKMLKSELNYVKQFLTTNFGSGSAKDLMVLFKDILNQEYSLPSVCRQIKSQMDHPSRLELVHVLFGLSQSDNEVHPLEVDAIRKISNYIGISHTDFDSIKAMFILDASGAYHILKIDKQATDDEIKRAYRKMANKYHPDKVSHLGNEFQKLAEEKFKAVSEAYRQIKKERNVV